MDRSQVSLRWETKQTEGWLAYSGDLPVAMVVVQFDGNVVWQIYGVQMKYTAKGYGDATSVAAAKRAVSRAWRVWLGRAGLRKGLTTRQKRAARIMAKSIVELPITVRTRQ